MKKAVAGILFLVLILLGWSMAKTLEINSQRQSLQPKQVVENYFKYWNEKNGKGILSTLTKKYAKYNIAWEFENLKSIKINSIAEESHTELSAIYRVQFELKNKKDGLSVMYSGTYTWSFTLIREDKNSPWLIDNYGEG